MRAPVSNLKRIKVEMTVGQLKKLMEEAWFRSDTYGVDRRWNAIYRRLKKAYEEATGQYWEVEGE